MIRTFAIIAASAFLAASAAGDEKASALEILDVTRIWDAAPHCAFTDLIEHEGMLFATFREAAGHVPAPNDPSTDGKIRIIVSRDDGGTWESAALIAEPGIDLRDPKLSVTPDGRVMVLIGGSYYRDGKVVKRLPRVAFSAPEKTTEFSRSQPVEIDPVGNWPNDWLWRVTFSPDGRGYGIVYQAGDENGLHLVVTDDGIRYSHVASLDVDGKPNEATIAFAGDGSMRVVLRREGGDTRGLFGKCSPPFDSGWEWTKLPMRLGGPDLAAVPNRSAWLLGSRLYPSDAPDRTEAGTAIWLVPDDSPADAEILTTLPSGGDTSYPGIITRPDGQTLILYYSSHEGSGTAAYLARGQMGAERPE